MGERKVICAQVGQFVISPDNYFGWQLIIVDGVIAKQIKGRQVHNGCRRTIPITSVRFCGDEVTARALYERLISSHALFKDERSASLSRRIARDKALIDEFTGEA